MGIANHTMTVSIHVYVNGECAHCQWQWGLYTPAQVADNTCRTSGSGEPLGDRNKCGLFNACTMKKGDIIYIQHFEYSTNFGFQPYLLFSLSVKALPCVYCCIIQLHRMGI